LPFVLGCRMRAGHADGLIAESGEGLDRAGGPAGGVEVLEGVRPEQVLQRTRFAEAAGGDVEADVLGEKMLRLLRARRRSPTSEWC
jgi:hypothetical protein